MTQILDVKSSNHGTIVPSINPCTTPWGEDCLDFKGTTSEINCGNDSSLNFTTETFGGYVWINKSVDNKTIFSRGLSLNDGYYFVMDSSGVPRLTINQSGTQQGILGATSVANNRWYLAGFVSVAGDKNYIYLNGADDSASSVARVNPKTSTRTFYIGDYDTSSFNYVGKMAAPFIGTFASKAAFEAAIQKEFNRVANKVVYKQDFESAAVTQGALGAGSTLPGTDWKVISGTWKINTATINGKTEKVAECVTDGVIAAPVSAGQAAYGRWDAYVNKVDSGAANLFGFAAQKADSYTGSTQNGYFMYTNNSELVGVAEITNGAFSAKFTTAIAYINTSQWYKWTITRNTEGVFTAYIDDVEVDESGGSGTNPFTDTTFTQSNYLTYEGGTGDSIALITKKFGVAV